MTEPHDQDGNSPPPGFLDQLVEWLASAMDAVGLNGRRVRWRWQAKRREIAETRARREVLMRGAKVKHKMCPACRALVAKDTKQCPDCGESMSGVSTPGMTRTVTNLLPGISGAVSLLMLTNGFWFVMMLMAWIKSGTAGGLGLMRAFDMELIVRFGAGLSHQVALSDGAITGAEWWRTITPIFLHGSIIHIFFNSYFLLNIGPLVEEIWGTERFWIIYLTTGIVGAACSLAWPYLTPNPTDIRVTVGASGALMGLVGLLLVYGLVNRNALGQSMKQLVMRLVIFMVIINFVFPGIDHVNHFGGFACGGLLALLVPTRQARNKAEANAWQLVAFAGVLLVVYSFYKVATFARAAAPPTF